jgi:hypothetical protein
MVMPWIFSERMHAQIVALNRAYPVTVRDFHALCENERYQVINLSPAGGESVFYRTNATLALYIEEIRACQEQIRNSLGVRFTDEEIRAIPSLTDQLQAQAQRPDWGSVQIQPSGVRPQPQVRPQAILEPRPGRYDLAQAPEVDPVDSSMAQFFAELGTLSEDDQI